ncbi:MAG: sulfite exporter TauE/SafE family protein [Acidobacteria bacterium]|nr:MAG: sulfite exporter TauE/SafE family protein [Acidobacteriota bacterium]PYS14043.1 MAG: sulfite exporter TauE/SafE family protein [Acidobacteriota bacterium]
MSPELVEFFRLAPLGLVVGAFGTLVGAGGGAVMVPVLLVLLPHQTAANVTAISLATVFFNAYSGTVAYMRMGRVDYRLGVLFTTASLPGAVLGVVLVRQMPRNVFDPIFGILLLGIGVFLLANPLGTTSVPGYSAFDDTGERRRTLLGSIGSAYIAVLSSLMGIGGGIIHVPFLIRVLKIPAHNATATSHFVLTFVALTATITHLAMGEFNEGLPQTMYLAVGVMMGAPIGAAISTRLHGSIIVRLLAIALCLIGLRLLARTFPSL